MRPMADLIIKSLGMYGLTIIISMLAALLIKLIVVSIARSGDKRKLARTKTEKVQPVAPARGDGVDPQHVAAISAAVYAVLGSHRIVHIAAGRYQLTWSSEGKRQLQSSHDVHHRT